MACHSCVLQLIYKTETVTHILTRLLRGNQRIRWYNTWAQMYCHMVDWSCHTQFMLTFSCCTQFMLILSCHTQFMHTFSCHMQFILTFSCTFLSSRINLIYLIAYSWEIECMVTCTCITHKKPNSTHTEFHKKNKNQYIKMIVYFCPFLILLK